MDSKIRQIRSNFKNILLFLPSMLLFNLTLYGQYGGYDSIVVTNNTDDPICISLQWDLGSTPCSSQGTQNASGYGTVHGGGGTKTIVPTSGYVTTVRIFNDGCSNSCLTPTLLDLGPGIGTYSGTYVHCTSGDTRTVTVTFSPGTGGINCGNNATITLNY